MDDSRVGHCGAPSGEVAHLMRSFPTARRPAIRSPTKEDPLTDIDNFTAAIRAVLADTDDRTNMRGLGLQAASLLPDHLLYEAAAAHLTGLARKLHNQEVRSHGVDGSSSDEVVWLKGRDVLLGDTDDSERELLAVSREVLADGLMKRAEQLRLFGAAGPTLTDSGHTSSLSTHEVLEAERRADRFETMAARLRALNSGDGGLAGAAQEKIAATRAELAQIREARAYYREMAEIAASGFVAGRAFRLTIAARKRILELFNLADTAPDAEEAIRQHREYEAEKKEGKL